MSGLTPEEEARQGIDAKLTTAGWLVQSREEIDLSARPGIAVREFPVEPEFGETDCPLYVDCRAIGALEARPAGHALRRVGPRSAQHAGRLPNGLPASVTLSSSLEACAQMAEGVDSARPRPGRSGDEGLVRALAPSLPSVWRSA